MTEIQFNVLVDPTLTEPPPDAYLFEGDLRGFFHDLIAGKPFPLTLALRDVKDVDTLLVVALFLHRDLAIHPGLPGLLAAFALACEEPLWGFAHVDRDLERFVRHVRAYLAQAGADRRKQGDSVTSAVEWLREYVHEGVLPQMKPARQEPTVITVGSNGFVLAEGFAPHREGWVALFRQGHLRGLLVSPQGADGRRAATIARKSPHVAYDLNAIAEAFNAVETAMGELPEWVVEGDLLGTPGTLILVQHLMLMLSRF
jgi:hypothetical protein